MKQDPRGRSRKKDDFARFYNRGGLPPSPIIRDEINKPIKIYVVKGVLCSRWFKLQVSTNTGVGDIVHLNMGSDGPHVSVLVTFLT